MLLHQEFTHPQNCSFCFVGVCPGGALNFFSGSRFPKCGACKLLFASEKGGLWTENFKIWGLVNWKFLHLETCELKMSKFGGLKAKIWAKIEAAEAKISKFSQKGVLWTDSFAWNGTLWTEGEAWKEGLQGRTSLYSLSRSVPPWVCVCMGVGWEGG